MLLVDTVGILKMILVFYWVLALHLEVQAKKVKI